MHTKKILVIAVILFVVGIVALIVARRDKAGWIKDERGQWTMHGNPAINDFESCARKYPVMKSLPEKCAIPNGPTFTRIYRATDCSQYTYSSCPSSCKKVCQIKSDCADSNCMAQCDGSNSCIEK